MTKSRCSRRVRSEHVWFLVGRNARHRRSRAASRAKTEASRDRIHVLEACHALVQNGALVVGMTNANLDYGKFILDASHGLDPRTTLATWGQGRIDVTTEAGTEPVRIPDLRPVVHLGFLHATASVAQNDLASLSVRLETLLITDSGETTRPPREITLALANYVWSLASELDTRPPSDRRRDSGSGDLHETNCATCHAPPELHGASRTAS